MQKVKVEAEGAQVQRAALLPQVWSRELELRDDATLSKSLTSHLDNLSF